MGPVLLTPMVTKPVWGSNQPVLTPDWVRLTKPVLETATIEVVPETMRSLLPAKTPVRPEPFPTKLVAEMGPETSRATEGVSQPIRALLADVMTIVGVLLLRIQKPWSLPFLLILRYQLLTL